MIKIKNRFTALLICLSILLTLISSYSSVFASGTISVGDYVQMGEYNGAPMLWRCISVDGSDALMIADTILCFKSFDAAGDDSMGSHGRGTNNGSYRKLYGSNYWADSNIRSWLNSDNTAGNVEFMCGNEPNKDSISRKYNEYENKSGFLTNFSFDEKAIIKTVSQKAILDKNEYADMSSYGTEAFEYNIYRENSMTNYDSAYSEQVSDKIFLPDIKQFETLCNNLGEDYAKGVISENAFSNASNLVENGFSANANWGWWLRTPVTEDSCFGVYVRYVRPDAKEVGLDYAMQTHLGIRPAFYIDGSITTIKAGTGTADDPYKPQKVTEEISSGTAVLSRFSENVVNISGNAGEENAGKTATVILIPKASYNSISIVSVQLPHNKVPHLKKLESARTYIQANFKHEIQVEILAERLGLSPSYFRKLFKDAYGIAPMQYITNLRINTAKDLLLSGEVNVTEASRLSGFDDIYYFSTLFKKQTGMSPTQYIKANR